MNSATLTNTALPGYYLMSQKAVHQFLAKEYWSGNAVRKKIPWWPISDWFLWESGQKLEHWVRNSFALISFRKISWKGALPWLVKKDTIFFSWNSTEVHTYCYQMELNISFLSEGQTFSVPCSFTALSTMLLTSSSTLCRSKASNSANVVPSVTENWICKIY